MMEVLNMVSQCIWQKWKIGLSDFLPRFEPPTMVKNGLTDILPRLEALAVVKN